MTLLLRKEMIRCYYYLDFLLSPTRLSRPRPREHGGGLGTAATLKEEKVFESQKPAFNFDVKEHHRG